MHNGLQYYSLQFTYTFQAEDQGKCVYFSYAKPFTYTDLIKDLNEVKQRLKNDKEGGESPSLRVINKKDEKQKSKKT